MKGRRKRNATIVISSSEDDDDDKDFSLKSDLSYSKPASVPPTNPNKRAKKASLSKSGPRPRKGPLTNDFDEVIIVLIAAISFFFVLHLMCLVYVFLNLYA